MPRTAQSVFDETRSIFGAVPNVSNDFVCNLCLGAVTGWPQCYDCYELFLKSECPRDLREHVVPMTIALNPSPWYGCLWTYKRAEFDENGPKVAALTYLWLMTHKRNIEQILGGAWDIITIVPSKREGVTFDTQDLRRALGLVKPIDDALRETLIFIPGSDHGRHRYTPEMFRPSATRVRGRRIVLIEDTWITGATALSAAGALMSLGATSIMITPMAREVKPEFWELGGPHPFCESVRSSTYDLATTWPRS